MRSPCGIVDTMSKVEKNGKIIRPSYFLVPEVIYTDRDLQLIDWAVFAIVYWFEHLKEGRCIAGNGTIASVIGVEPRSVQNALTRLEAKGYIARTYKDEAKRNRKEIITLVDFAVRKLEDRGQTSENRRIDERKVEDRRVRKVEDQKNNTINNKSEVELAPQGGAVSLPDPINEFIEATRVVNPACNRLFANVTQRKAAKELLKVMPIERWQAFFPWYASHLDDRYCPRATTPVQIAEKFGQIMAYARQQKKDSELPAAVKI